MSKSRRNVIDPTLIIDAYGADTARWFMLSDSPPDRDLEWTEAGVEGAYRFVQRLWRLVLENLEALPPADSPMPAEFSPPALGLRKAVHKTIAAVTNDIERFAFNRAVAQIHGLTNTITAALEELRAGGAGWVLREALESLTKMIGPMMPHLAEELWQRLGHEALLTYSPWPEVEAALTVDDSVTVAVQVNGKLRATLDLVRDTEAASVEAAALALPEIERVIGERTVRRVIVVPNRVVNVVL